MKRSTRFAFFLFCAVVGALVGGSLVLAAGGSTEEDARSPSPGPDAQPTTTDKAIEVTRPPRSVAPRRSLLLAWAPSGETGGLPPRTEMVLEEMPGIIDATTVVAGLDWIRSSRASDGARVDRPPSGMAIPVEVAYVEPGEYAAFVPPGESDAVRSLRPGAVLMAETETELRGAASGLKVRLSSGTVESIGVLSDVAAGGYEMVRTGRPPRSWVEPDRFVLMHVRSGVGRARITKRIEPLLSGSRILRVKAQGETPFLRYGDAVLPQMLIKETFGEFAGRPLPDGRIELDPEWVKDHIRTARVPVLGVVACNRALLPQLRRALKQVVSDGITQTINPAQYGGCFGPRFVSSNPHGRISHHAWGAAIDINVAENGFGTRPDQDERLIDVMRSAGFTWGGDWLVPDGMHFEWIRFP